MRVAVFKTEQGLHVVLLAEGLVVVGLCAEGVVGTALVLALEHAAFGDIVRAAAGEEVVEVAHVVGLAFIVRVAVVVDVFVLELRENVQFGENLEVGMHEGARRRAACVLIVHVQLVEQVEGFRLQSERLVGK